jgi:hypothetical protein
MLFWCHSKREAIVHFVFHKDKTLVSLSLNNFCLHPMDKFNTRKQYFCLVVRMVYCTGIILYNVKIFVVMGVRMNFLI